MTVYEFICTHESALKQIVNMSVKPSDVRYIEMYKDYERMKAEGHKTTYIIQYLSDEYEADARTIYRVIGRFSKNINM